MNVAITYCLNGHLWVLDLGERCLLCMEEERAPALKIIQEIEGLLPSRRSLAIRGKLRQLREILQIEDELY